MNTETIDTTLSTVPTGAGSPGTDAHFIRLQNINKVFGDRHSKAMKLLHQGSDNDEIKAETGCHVALRNINLDIPSNGIFCIMGLSGSGKSTLLRHINRLIDPDTGTVQIQDVDVTALSIPDLQKFRQKRIAMVFQHFGLLPHFTVQQNAEFALRVRGVPKRERAEQARYWLDEMELSGYEAHYYDELSGGMRQRVGLARALAAGTDILLMDEPFSALDPLIRRKLQTLLLNLQDRLNKTIVFITHDVEEARTLGGTVALLNQGRLIQQGSLEQMAANPADEYVASFLTSSAEAS